MLCFLECEGEDFHRTISPDASPRILLKQLHFNMLGYELLERALAMIRGTVSKPILISENGAHCTVTVVNTDKPELLKGKPFYMVDALAYFNRFIVIDGLENIRKKVTIHENSCYINRRYNWQSSQE